MAVSADELPAGTVVPQHEENIETVYVVCAFTLCMFGITATIKSIDVNRIKAKTLRFFVFFNNFSFLLNFASLLIY